MIGSWQARVVGRNGFIVAAAIFAVVALLSQVLTRADTRRLYRRLSDAYTRQGDDLAHRVTELEWLRDIGRRLNSTRTLEEALEVVYDGIRGGLGYDRVGIQVLDQDRGVWAEQRGTDAHGRKISPRDRTATIDRDALTWRFPSVVALLAGAEFYHSNDAYAETPDEARVLWDGQPTHCLVVPLRVGERMTGLISVDNLLSKRPISPDDAGPLLALATHVGTAVENARLRDRERAERARLEVLLESARALNSTLDQEQILYALAARLVAALGATNALFSHIDLEQRMIKVLAEHVIPGHGLVYPDDDYTSLDEYPTVEAMLTARRHFIGFAHDPDCPRDERDFLIENNLYAELMMPVVVRGEPSGVLEVYWKHPLAIGADAVALCAAIAEQVAVALQNARLYADAAERADRDPLTGLLNHRALHERIDHTVAAGMSCTLLLLDVDNFKLFNDTYGHLIGDAVLMQIAATLSETCRDGDIAGRYGGDEFAVLLRGASDDEACAVMRRLSMAVRTRPHVTSEGTIIPLSISVGNAAFPTDGRSRQELVAVADNRMYAAKQRGGGHAAGDDQEAAQWQETRPRDAADLLGNSPFGVLDGLVNAVDAKDRYTRLHSEHVTRLALTLADALGLPREQRRVLSLAGPLHDVGKIAVPDRILRKPGALSAEEYAAITRHVTYGVAIIRGVLDDAAVIDAVAYHHERWDGRGYPHGLPGPQTPLLGRIMQVADAASAMSLDRPYRKGLPWEQIVAALWAGAGTQFDPALVGPFIAAMEREQRQTA